MALDLSFGVIGGSGALGRAMVRAILARGVVQPRRLWISNRSGTAPDAGSPPEVRVTSDSRALTEACDVILFSVPP